MRRFCSSRCSRSLRIFSSSFYLWKLMISTHSFSESMDAPSIPRSTNSLRLGCGSGEARKRSTCPSFVVVLPYIVLKCIRVCLAVSSELGWTKLLLSMSCFAASLRVFEAFDSFNPRTVCGDIKVFLTFVIVSGALLVSGTKSLSLMTLLISLYYTAGTPSLFLFSSLDGDKVW